MKLQEYKKLMTILFANNTRRGFVGWRDCGRLCMAVTGELEAAKEALCAENRYADLFSLANWTYVKWSNTDKDDSGGDTQYFCECVYDIWETVYMNGESCISHDSMLETMLEYLDGRVLDYMEDDIYKFILRHFKNEKELARKEQFLLKVMEDIKKHLPEREILQYDLAVKEDYYVRVMADQKRPIREIRDFLNTRNGYTNRKLLAQIEQEYGNYDEAIAIYRSQIEERPESYWSDAPRKALMKIYLLQGNQKAYNDELYNMMCAHTEDSRYYLEYKALFTEEEWKTEWEKLLEKYKNRLHSINSWLSFEDRYDLIMNNAEPDDEFVIDAYEKELFDLYPERCFQVLANAADRQAQRSKKRRDYKYIARILKKIAAHPGGRALAAELAEKYRMQYPRRTAMIDELKKF
ncbi:MAG: hypothetical protein E7233_14055 [Lachnospiraceae bacterium]|nr:hypothetical protein [Lachnospiraceae bacterium]